MKMKIISSRGFSLVECLIASAIAALAIIATLSLILYVRMSNEIEQERTRAIQIICQRLDEETFHLFTWTKADSIVTIWDNGTPNDPNDDTKGTLEVIVRDPDDPTNVFTNATQTAGRLVEIEVTLRWKHRGPRPVELLQETVITCKAP
jgi:prepilin-type N-terminal cleavage/methylation domain-containing protein